MDTPNSTDPVGGTPAPTPSNSTNGVRRRDLIVGGVAGLTSLIAGGVAGGIVGRRTGRPDPTTGGQNEPPKDPEAHPERGVDPHELAKERASATRLSYAQYGEDLVLKGLFAGLAISKPSYLDIGAYEPIYMNNTYVFYGRGATGVLVEPNVDLTDKLRRLRPDDKVLVAGIGITDQAEADSYVMTHPSLSTFDKTQVDLLVSTGQQQLVRVVKMPLVNINRVIADQFGGAAPDLISIDIEGLDYAVLKTLDYTRFRPKIICAETLITGTNKHNLKTPELMAEKGYELRGMTFPNMCFVDKQLLPK